jgi:hypothetical protein
MAMTQTASNNLKNKVYMYSRHKPVKQAIKSKKNNIKRKSSPVTTDDLMHPSVVRNLKKRAKKLNISL